MNRRTIRLLFALSMPVVTAAVKAQEKSLPTFNKRDTRREDLKDSVKNTKTDFAELIRTLMASGHETIYPNGYAQAIGLDRPRPIRAVLELDGHEARKCHIVYEQDTTNGDHPICVHLVRSKKTTDDVEERYFRVGLDGQLERVITLRGKLDNTGKPIPEGRSRIEEDIHSPAIRKIFQTEMNYWVKDWLVRQKKVDATKATASATKPTDTMGTAASATAH